MAGTGELQRRVQPLLNEEVSPSEAIVRVLEQAGIDLVFGMPGGNMGAVFNALYDHRETVRSVLVREEARAGVMAEVYGRLTGRPGVVIAQGAFLANVTLGAIEGYLLSSPMLLMGDPERPRPIFGTFAVSIRCRRVRHVGCQATVLSYHQADDRCL